MKALGRTLAAILLFAVATLWVRDRWAVCGMQAAVFLCAAWALVRVARRRERVSLSAVPLLLICLCLWALAQLAMRWTAVPAETSDAVLYWLAAACLAWLASEICSVPEARARFLVSILWAGSAICLAGLVQLFTSHGRVFWLFGSGFDSDVIGPFVSRNQYAAMVELLLPVALTIAFRRRNRAVLYLILSAALVASVVASGSRAGTVLILAEAVCGLVLLLRSGHAGDARKWLGFAALIVAFTCVVGYEYAWSRFRDRGDAFEFRREFVQSSVAMVRAQPLHGFGFGTWPSVYREFARIDTGAPVNHSHNEWLQWTAEGGLPALGLMLAIAALSGPAAVRSIWGLGVPAVLLHSLVDYPFLRPGQAAWIFVFLGALAGYNGVRRRVRCPGAAACAVAAVLVFPACFAARTAWADALYRGGTADGIARAARLRPDRAEYQLALAQAGTGDELLHLQTAVRLNPYLTDAHTLLAAQLEMRGDTAGSEAALLRLARHDRQYAPAWALANFYFRTGRQELFWQWARVAAGISPGGASPLFGLCLARTGDSRWVWDRVVKPRRNMEREFAAFLLDRNLPADAQKVATEIAADATGQDREFLLQYVDRSLAQRRYGAAAEIWNTLCVRHLLPYAPAAAGSLVNGDFSRPILDRGFDWRAAPPGCALAAQTNAEGPALELFLAADRPEACEISSQVVRLRAGADYELHFQYRTMYLLDPTGLHWSLGAGQEYELRSAPEWIDAVWRWHARESAGRLVFGYRRALGSTRREGTVLLRRLVLQTPSGGG